VEPSISLDAVSTDLIEGSQHVIKSVSWAKPKKSAT